ncbi:glycosyltransferase family 4 protein [Gammaproteobacteria bacterium]|jgi:glycosyltransferase involved in cell wall biosynthesis|nr:glycosyltransferase family 4 protein [Gammaproteobacteria bacterium]
MNILFIHQNFPGQFKHLAPALVKAGHKVTALILAKTEAKQWNGVKLISYSLTRGNAKDAHPWTVDFESKVIRGEACLKAALALKDQGYTPEVVVAHPGWGESLFLKEVWPEAKLKLYCEFFYHTRSADVGFDPEFSSTDPADAGRVMLKNANILLQFQQADAGISPTHWQASTFPEHISKKIRVIHDGIDTDILSPNPDVQFTLDSGKVLTQKDEVITFVNRALEPYRGFHTFMRSLPSLLREKPSAEVLIVGKEGVSYGAQPKDGLSWKQQFSNEVFPQLDESQRSRVHFLNTIPYDRFIALLQVSTVHVYLTYPFVLSWSLLEAMSVGCAIVASDTQPLHEAITHDETGVLVDFFDPEALATATISLLNDSDCRSRLSSAAREFAKANYDLKTVCLPKQIQWVQE